MRILLLLAAIVATFPLFAQSSRVFSESKISRINSEGNFQVNCKQSFAISCYKAYFKGFTIKKLNTTDFVAEGLGGTVNATIVGNDKFTTVSLQVVGAGFPNLSMNLKNFIDRELLQDTLNYETKRLNDMAKRMADLEKDNAFQDRKIEQDKTDIANRETKKQLNSSAIEKYKQAIGQQEGLVSEIQEKIDEIAHLPIK